MRFARKDSDLFGMFATRDASWYDRPDTSTAKRWHALTADGSAACSGIPLDVAAAQHGSRIGATRMVCRRKACQQAYADTIATGAAKHFACAAGRHVYDVADNRRCKCGKTKSW